MPKFQKGHAKVGGRKPGTPNRKTIWIREQMSRADFDVFVEMKKACVKGNFALIDSLCRLLPFLTPPMIPKEEEIEDPSEISTPSPETDKLSDDELIRAAKSK